MYDKCPHCGHEYSYGDLHTAWNYFDSHFFIFDCWECCKKLKVEVEYPKPMFFIMKEEES
ncbi:MAG: hypothetical protein ISP01_05490 [Methanobrevibacter arboriphilus]|uniref:Uncharacterized protein n=1 Tax=Methanobrevibacter arboriphilus TaxID=39441 RepID=A0A843ACX6_METAZ|nr:hypothetical protein [Methanobrevibacter arboriphilus]MBF4468842.1 hypothetical protein [Methanobrevibacter arboriphilus]